MARADAAGPVFHSDAARNARYTHVACEVDTDDQRVSINRA